MQRYENFILLTTGKGIILQVTLESFPMSLIVALFCIADAPTLAAPLIDPASNSTSVLVLNPTASTKQRSTWEILWTCLATIFACTWVSIHPNIPSSNLQRLELMVWAILTPEMIIFWAMRQWRHARALTKLYEGTLALA